jgi:hypothetical protein
MPQGSRVVRYPMANTTLVHLTDIDYFQPNDEVSHDRPRISYGI